MRGKKVKELRRFLKDGMGIDILQARSKKLYRNMKKEYIKNHTNA